MLNRAWALGLAVVTVASLAAADPAFATSKPPHHNRGTGGGTGGTTTQQPPPASSNLRAVGSGDLKYEWSRGGVKVELRDRHGHWTQDEAQAVAAGLDRLNDPYVRKAVSGGLEKIYRDGRVPTIPFMAFSSIDPNTIAGFAMPAWPYHYVTLGDLAFTEGVEGTFYVVAHELGHCVDNDGGTHDFTTVSWTTAIHGIKSYNGFVTDYARTNRNEDFAESAAWFWLAPDELRRVAPAKWAYMHDRAFGGADSPAAVRFPWLQAIAPVHPSIDRLGDSSDNPGSLVQVHGTYLMAPFDGGYNTVRYRGTRAANLPISRRLTYSWVPRISTGSAPVTLETQDGTSAPVAFTVTKPWWKFW